MNEVKDELKIKEKINEEKMGERKNLLYLDLQSQNYLHTL